MTQRPIEILLVEDSPGDIWLTRETLLKGSVPKNITVITNGEQALDYLRRKKPFADAMRPDLVLLDLNLPRRDGLDVLRTVKNDPDLQSITVIVLTTSDAPSDVNTAYDLHANCFVVKPVNLEDFTVAVRGIENFWMKIASLPTVSPQGRARQELAESATSGAETNEGPVSHSHAAPRRRRIAVGWHRPSACARRQRWSHKSAPSLSLLSASRSEQPALFFRHRHRRSQ